MKLYSIPALMMAAVSVYAGLHFLFIYFNRKINREYLAFSLSCFAIAAYDCFSALLYSSVSPVQGLMWQKLQFSAAALFMLFFLHFVLNYVKQSPGKTAFFISALLLIFAAGGFFVTEEWGLSLASPMSRHISPGGLHIATYHEVKPGLFYSFQYAIMGFTALFIAATALKKFREEDEPGTGHQIAALLLFLAAAVNDALVGMGFYVFIYVLEYVYLLIILSMAYVLQKKFINLYSEVEELNFKLEDKINSRTMELFFSDISLRLYTEFLSEIKTHSAPPKPGIATHASADLSSDPAVISNPDFLFKSALEKGMSIISADTAFLLLAGQDGRLTLKASSGEDSLPIFAYPENTVKEVFKSGKTFMSNEGSKAPQGGAYSLCVPVRSRHGILGACYFERSSEAFSFNECGMAEAFFARVSAAMENSLIYQKALSQIPHRQPSLTPSIREKIKKAIAYLEENFRDDVSREGLASMVNMHPDSLGRYFKMFTDKKISDFTNELRIKAAMEELKTTGKTVIEIAFNSGFESLTTFNRAFVKIAGTTPTEYREAGKALPD